MTTFSARQGLSVPNAEITVRNDAPDELREVLPIICYHVGLRPGELCDSLFDLILEPPSNSRDVGITVVVDENLD
jgi:hypothetical protein